MVFIPFPFTKSHLSHLVFVSKIPNINLEKYVVEEKLKRIEHQMEIDFVGENSR